MVGALSGAVAVALLAGTGLAIAALAVREWPTLLLGAYVVAFAEVVGLVLLLSPLGAVRRPVLLATLAALAAAAAAFWWRGGRPLPARPRLGFVARGGPLAALTVVVSLTLAYVVALALGTPPTTWDSLVYHLARAALWRQAGGAGYVEDAYEDRMNANPPNAEIAVTFALEVTRHEHFAAFVQLGAALACVVGVYALARRLGLAAREAAFGSLLVLTLPVVALQATTTQNDLVVAALLLAATVFVLGESRAQLGLAAVATALAMGTKVTAAFALPVLCLVVLVAPPRTARIARLAALAIGTVAGSYWYVVNLVHTGRPLGDRPDTDLIVIGDLRENVLAGFARTLDAFDLSGAEGADRFVLPGLADSDLLAYVVVAAALTIGLFVVGRLTGRPSARISLLAGTFALLPLTVSPLAYLLWRVFAKLHDLLGSDTEALPAGEPPSTTTASESLSWFGPLGPFLVAGALVAGVILYRRRALPALAVVLAAAPLVWLVLLALSLGYDNWQGRFFVYPIALSAALWGLLLRRAPLAWAAVGVGAATVGLCFVNYLEKPSGLQLFADRSTESIWHMERWEAQTVLRPEMTPVLRFVEEQVPRDASLALALRGDDFGYPYFGPRGERDVELVPPASDIPASDAEWLVASPRHASMVGPACWQLELETLHGWKIFSSAAGEASC